ncbi:MAG: rhomboid family intramembrane serine protease [Planctomycetes bacterium]|nr:rhomboid family intramembrane serine protease [Planctomycetota bacterium]
MIPIRDKNPSDKTSWVVYGLIVINVLVFLFEISLPAPEREQLFSQYGLIPHRVKQGFQGEISVLTGIVIPAFTSMFLHGGWVHLLGNMWFLYIFGDNVEAKLRKVPFLLFYLFCGLAASAGQVLVSGDAPLPIVGASGAIAGVLGAYIITWPKARILTLLPLFYLITFVDLPAYVVLGMWFLIQFFRGFGSIAAGAMGGVAYWAHVGGFVAGIVLMLVLPKRKGVREAGRQSARSDFKRRRR